MYDDVDRPMETMELTGVRLSPLQALGRNDGDCREKPLVFEGGSQGCPLPVMVFGFADEMVP